MRIIMFFLMLLILLGNAWGQTSIPPKYQLGSRENPYYTTSDDHISLRQYFEARHKALEENIDARFKAMEQAVDVARNSMERRLDAMNEFRASLKDQSAKFVTKDEYLSQTKGYDADIRLLMTAKDQAEGKASQNQVFIVFGLSALSLLFSLLTFKWNRRKKE